MPALKGRPTYEGTPGHALRFVGRGLSPGSRALYVGRGLSPGDSPGLKARPTYGDTHEGHPTHS